jgi:hypothetical protein
MRRLLINHHKVIRWPLQLLALCAFLLLQQPGVYAQTNTASLQTPVTVTGNKISLLQVFRSIKKQTGLTFFYSNQLLDDNEKISLDFKNTKLEDVLAYIFKEKNISYEIRGKRLLLNEKQQPVKQAVIVPKTTTEKSTAPEGIIKGQVMDADGKALIGVTVMVKGKANNAVATDELGIFTLNAQPGDVLAFSMVGMQTEEV